MIHTTCFISKRLYTSFIPILLLAIANDASARKDGIAGRTGANGGPTCESAACHAAGAAVPTITFEGPTTVAPGSTTTYTVVISGGPAINAGVGIVAPGATLAVTDATITKTATVRGNTEIVNLVAVPFAAGATTVSFPFSLTAPATPGTTTIFAAGLSGNGDNLDTGDGTGVGTLAVTVEAAAPPTTPTAVIKSQTAGTVGVPITFDASGSTAPAGATIASYAWTFSDGQTDTAAVATKTFTAPGDITVNLTVTDSLGATATATITVAIAAAGTPLPPTAVPGGPYTGTTGVAILFDGSASSDADGTIASYSWDFGDNSPPATVVSPSYAYAAAGTYTVTLTVTDNTNATGQATTTATITDAGAPPPPPTTPPVGGTPTAGETLYVAECEACHGVNGIGGPDGSVAGESAEDILEAIVEVPVMNALSTLTEADVQSIADFLAGSGPAAADAVAGATLYVTFCESCHGVAGAGGTASAVVGESAEDIQEAIVEEPTMADLNTLTPEEVANIAAYLQDPAAIPPAAAGTPTGSAGNPNATGSQGQSPTATSGTAKASSGGGTADLFFVFILGAALGVSAMRRRSAQLGQ